MALEVERDSAGLNASDAAPREGSNGTEGASRVEEGGG